MRAHLFRFVVALIALAASAHAEERRGSPSLDRVLPRVRQMVPGTFYDAEGPFIAADGSASYRLKWMLPDGRIVWFYVDGHTGQVLGNMPQIHAPGRFREEGPPGPFPLRGIPGYGNGDRDRDDRRDGRGRRHPGE